jgi:hypothetical protein
VYQLFFAKLAHRAGRRRATAASANFVSVWFIYKNFRQWLLSASGLETGLKRA